MNDLEPIGVIDIGSNSVRLVVYEGAMRSLTPLFNEKVLCGLGRAVASTGSLGDDASIARWRRCAVQAIARVLGVKNVRAIATAAVRERRRPIFHRARRERRAGSSIEILSGEKEAELAAQGIMMGFVNADGIAGDLGGGSLELIDIAKRQAARGGDIAARRLAADRRERAAGWRKRVDIADAALSELPGSATVRAGRSTPSAAPGARSPACTWSTPTIRCA